MGRFRHEEGIDVARLGVVAAATVHSVTRGQRWLRAARRREGRGLVHVVPEPRCPGPEEGVVLQPPPAPHLGIGEIGQGRPPGPHHAVKDAPARERAEAPAGDALLVDPVAAVPGHGGVDDHHQTHTLGGQLVRQLRHVREVLVIDGEDAVLVHELDVEMDGAQWQVPVAEPGRDGPDLIGGRIAPARLVVPEGPPGWKGRASGQLRVALDGAGHRSGGDVVTEGTVVEPSLEVAIERERGPVRVLVEGQVAPLGVDADVGGSAEVDGVVADGVVATRL